MAHGLRRFFISRLLPLLEISKIGIAQEHFLVEVVHVANRRRLGQLPVLIEKVERSEHPVQVALAGHGTGSAGPLFQHAPQGAVVRSAGRRGAVWYKIASQAGRSDTGPRYRAADRVAKASTRACLPPTLALSRAQPTA